METAKTTPRRSSSAAVPRSPRLKRTASGESALSLPESRSFRSPSPHQPHINRPSRSATSSPRPSVERSRSAATTTRGKRGLEAELIQQPATKLLPSISSSPKIPVPSTADDVNGGGGARLSIRRPSPHNLSMRRARSTLTGSPSAWALSPGRTLAPLPPSSPFSLSPSLTASPSLESSSSSKGRSSSLSSSLWRYFQRQKRASPEEEEGFHQYRMMYNRLLQWRFANAKSEASICIIKKKAEDKLFAVWVKVCKMRNLIAEKRSRVQRLSLKIKLLGIVCPQLQLLNEWEVVEKRNSEAVGRVSRKLSAYSTKLPLVNGAKVDIIDLYEAMHFAMEVMQEIEIHITKFLSKGEETCDILTQVIRTMGGHDKCFQELERTISAIMSLEAEEKSLRANLIQANKEAWDTQNSCKFHRFISGAGVFNPLYSLLDVS